MKGTKFNIKIAHRKKLEDETNVMSEILNEFCKTSSLQTFKYFTHTSVNLFEKIFILVFYVCTGILLACALTFGYQKWNSQLVVINKDPRISRVNQEPFPSITICNRNRVDKSKVSHFAINSREYLMASNLCFNHAEKMINMTQTEWNNILEFTRNISFDCETMLLECKFGTISYNCTELFQYIYTDEGGCCNFNILPTLHRGGDISAYENYSFWDPEYGYSKHIRENFIPHKTYDAGQSVGLYVVIDTTYKNYFCKYLDSKGFKILVNDPMSIGSVKLTGMLVPAGEEIIFNIIPQKYIAEPDIIDIPIHDRNCYFQVERNLTLYTVYTQRSCYWDCLYNYLISNCNCTYPHLQYGVPKHRMCTHLDANCTKIAEDSQNECYSTCLPSCNNILYNCQIFTAPIFEKGIQFQGEKWKKMGKTYILENISIINLVFPNSQYRADKLTKVLRNTSIFANITGLMSLCFGCSVISLAEIIYFLFIVPLRRIYKKKIQKTRVKRIYVQPKIKLIKGIYPALRGFPEPHMQLRNLENIRHHYKIKLPYLE